MNQLKSAFDLKAKFWLVLRLRILFYILLEIGEYGKSDPQEKKAKKKTYLLISWKQPWVILSDLTANKLIQIILVKLVTRLTYKSIIFWPIVSSFSSYSINIDKVDL